MRDDFSWAEAEYLREADPDGNPAMWHGLIYIDRKDQLEALDQLRVYWSAIPISQRYIKQFRGKCGRVEHSTDGRGVVVYAVFPARFFNVMKTFGMQAAAAHIDPPFRFIVPTPPDEADYLNADGSIKYSALASSKYLAWLQTHPTQQPGWTDALKSVKDKVTGGAEALSDVVSDTLDWVANPTFEGGVDLIEVGFDYAQHPFNEWIPWVADALDTAWENTQEALQELVLLFDEKVELRFQMEIRNRDKAFPTGSVLKRAWGAWRACEEDRVNGCPVPAVPNDAALRIRHWGWGFLPVMDETKIDGNGYAKLEASRYAEGRDGALCVELDSNYASITSDLIPNEVCDFMSSDYRSLWRNDWWKQARDQTYHFWIDQKDLFHMSLLSEAVHYTKVSIQHDPHKIKVLTGPVANQLTKVINGGESRAMVPCLDFPGMSASMIPNVAGTLTGVGGVVLPGLEGILATVATFGNAIIEQDMFWPDAPATPDDVHHAYDSRGTLTHEYGHFAMCSMMYAENHDPTALRGLLPRIFEGQNDSRNDEIALMTETMADAFSLQVAGAAAYIYQIPPGLGQVRSRVGYCVASDCVDFNYQGNSHYVHNGNIDPFYDELARYVALTFDAFDSKRLRTAPDNDVWNGDMWTGAAGTLQFSSVGYIGNDDEPVALNGPAWKTWIKKWLARGRVPNVANVMGGLADTIRENYSWCDACEVFAAHNPVTPQGIAMANLSVPRTFDIRQSRWMICLNNSFEGGPAPEPYGNFDAQCQACPPLQFANPAANPPGKCTQCPPNWVPRGTQCVECGPGEIATASNECVACDRYEYTDGNTCKRCPTGKVADRVTNTCVFCPVDMTFDPVDLQCDKQVEIDEDRAPNDICPDQFWLELQDISEIAQGSGINVWAEPVQAQSSENACLASTAKVVLMNGVEDGWQYAASMEVEGEWMESSNILPDKCVMPKATLPASAVTPSHDTLRIHAKVALNSMPAAGWVFISSPHSTACEFQ